MLTVRKITISLSDELVAFADTEATRRHISRSQLIAEALARLEVAETERRAADGYQFYASEATEFSEASAVAVAEAVAGGG